MKPNKKRLHQQRKILDQKLQVAPPPTHLKNGWIQSVRSALGITTRQLAELMQVSQNSVSQLEGSEKRKSATLKKLADAAEAMDCELVYSFVPKNKYSSFDDLLQRKAEELASELTLKELTAHKKNSSPKLSSHKSNFA